MATGILEDPMGVPRALFWAATGFYLLFLVVTAFAFRSNLRSARADRGAVRRSGRAALLAFAAGAAVAVLLWFPIGPVFDSWSRPYAFCAYLWWTLPFGSAAAAVWVVMSRARYGPVNRST